MTATQISIVHEVVMQKRIVMVGLKCTSRHKDSLGILLEEIIRKEHKHWAYALSSHREHITYRFVKRRRTAVVRKLHKIVVDELQYLVCINHIYYVKKMNVYNSFMPTWHHLVRA